MKRLCGCGCGSEVKHRFLRGHNAIADAKPKTLVQSTDCGEDNIVYKLCYCGCGDKVTGKYAKWYIRGHQNLGVRFTKEHRRKMSEAGKGRIVSDATRKKQSDTRKGKQWNPYGTYGRKIPFTEKEKKEINRKKGRSLSKTLKDPKQRKRLSDNSKRLWKTAEYRRHNLRAKRIALSKHPNKCEKFIKDYLDKLKVKYKFQHECLGFAPDFILEDKKIIECNGKYWHSLPEVIERDKRKMKAFKKHEYKVLIITDREIWANKKKVKNRIKKFIL